MNALPNLDSICKRIVDTYKKVYGDDIEGIYLYGSYARGDFDEDSDIDIAAIVNGERLDLQKKLHTVWNEANRMDLEYDTLTSTTVIPIEEFKKYRDELPYYRNIYREGKRID